MPNNKPREKEVGPAAEEFVPETGEGEPSTTGERFQVWSKGVCLMNNDHEAFLNVYIEGQLVYALEAKVDFEDPSTLQFGASPKPIGFTVRAKGGDLHGQDVKDLGRRRWSVRNDVEVQE